VLEHITLWSILGVTLAIAVALNLRARRLERVLTPEVEPTATPLPAKEVLHV
jgi:hypothetical protein